MARGIGRALQKAVAREGLDVDLDAEGRSLAYAGRAAILATVFESPGISFQELADRVHLTRQSASKIASELSGFGLVSVAEDGRHRRAYPTDLLVRKREANRSRADAFGQALLARLADDGLAPELMSRDETTL